jgi:acyl carrier protein
MSESESVQQRVLRVIAANQRLPIESVTPESTFEGLGIDSLDRLNILFDLEGEFDIQVNDEQAKAVTDMQELIAGIQLLVDAKTDPAAAAIVAQQAAARSQAAALKAAPSAPEVKPASPSGTPEEDPS